MPMYCLCFVPIIHSALPANRSNSYTVRAVFSALTPLAAFPQCHLIFLLTSCYQRSHSELFSLSLPHFCSVCGVKWNVWFKLGIFLCIFWNVSCM
ncbi:hypothetical protein XELAEV_18015828mg [Xenopus laevis]|uniref:Uncharacterized protein n=1 Tax=Xenopus laevis TaxID=8355 RepID=A0A974HWC1_XENLA|nr:hypothetical protein XELAEV_18015828mg [Xenopus laevis]